MMEAIPGLNKKIKDAQKPGGYLTIVGDKVIFKKFLTGKNKEYRDKLIENMAKGIVSFDITTKI